MGKQRDILSGSAGRRTSLLEASASVGSPPSSRHTRVGADCSGRYTGGTVAHWWLIYRVKACLKPPRFNWNPSERLAEGPGGGAKSPRLVSVEWKEAPRPHYSTWVRSPPSSPCWEIRPAQRILSHRNVTHLTMSSVLAGLRHQTWVATSTSSHTLIGRASWNADRRPLTRIDSGWLDCTITVSSVIELASVLDGVGEIKRLDQLNVVLVVVLGERSLDPAECGPITRGDRNRVCTSIFQERRCCPTDFCIGLSYRVLGTISSYGSILSNRSIVAETTGFE